MIELAIVMDDQGKVNVTGPLEDRVLCYGLLEIAKEVIAKQAGKPQDGGRIVAPVVHPGSFLRRPQG